MGRGAKAYALPDVPAKGTNVRTRLHRQTPKGNRPDPIIPDSGAYAIRPYPDGRKDMIVF